MIDAAASMHMAYAALVALCLFLAWEEISRW